MLDYTEGFGDPLVAMLTAPERSRKWAPWMIAANSLRADRAVHRSRAAFLRLE